eukprot:TRINITY_DN1074_c0_g1_i1.p3 TRINITY_DN1074_c0_g1~~TRINITY_DN1074_c0_g1_i1.p3  ORF type:complete len:203 (+),score=72.20 TRINITY_DN1074_c0_g1_i1:27-611(+)
MDLATKYARKPVWPARREACCLLVIDMQQFFGETSASVAAPVRACVEACRRAGVRVAFTQHGHEDTARDGGMLAEFWSELVVRGTPGWRLVDGVAPGGDEQVFHKKTYSAFCGTQLQERLREWGVDTLILAGVLTNCCIETTARDAFCRGFRVVVVPDATATSDRELHAASLAGMAFSVAYLVPVRELQHFADA